MISDSNINIAQKLDILRIMKQKGVEKALQYFPEQDEFIHFYKDWDFEEAEREILKRTD